MINQDSLHTITNNAGLPELTGFDFVEFFTGNAQQSMHFYRTALGFTPVAVAGLETGVLDRQSFVVEQGGIRLVLTSPLGPDGPIVEHLRVHSDSIKDVAFAVDDAEQAFRVSVERGARPVMEPTVFEDEYGCAIKAVIATYGDMVHSFIQRDGYKGVFLPGYRAISHPATVSPTGLAEIDHVAVGVEAGTMDRWADFYNGVLSFHESHREDVMTEYSGMKSKVVQNQKGTIKFPIVEPAQGKRRSQLEEYLTFHQGPGVQHLALATDDIIETTLLLRKNGIEFLRTPAAYYDLMEDRLGKINEDLLALRELGILVDQDEWGLLLQVFTKPVQSRPTFFLEIVQRKGARGFGGRNIKALFEAIEREQAQRGTL